MENVYVVIIEDDNNSEQFVKVRRNFQAAVNVCLEDLREYMTNKQLDEKEIKEKEKCVEEELRNDMFSDALNFIGTYYYIYNAALE